MLTARRARARDPQVMIRGASIRHRRGTSKTRRVYVHSVGDSESSGSLKARWAPASSRREPLTTLGLNNVKASSCVDEHEFLSLTFVGSSENVGRDPSPSPARSRHYQTPMSPERTMISLLRITRTIEKWSWIRSKFGKTRKLWRYELWVLREISEARWFE